MGFYKNKERGLMLRTFCLLAVLAAATGCIKDGADDCGPQSYNFIVRAYDINENDVTDNVNDVVLYVFDSDMLLVEEIKTTVGQSVNIDAQGVHIVAWGNLMGGNQTRPSLSPGDHKDSGLITLIPFTRANTYNSPNDLFYGTITVNASDMTEERVLPIIRKVGSMTVKIKGLKEYTGFNDDNYSIKVSETHNSFDFYGNCCGDMVGYRPAGAFTIIDGTKYYAVTPFNMVPETGGVNIEIFHDTQLVATVSADDKGSPITVTEGLLTNVLIALSKGTLSVSVSLTDWGKEEVGKEF